MGEMIGGAIFAAFFLVGRWCPDRLQGDDSSGLILTAPRTWIALAMVVCCSLACLQRSQRVTEILDPLAKKFITRSTFANLTLLIYMAVTYCWTPMAAIGSEKLWEVLTVALTTGCLSVWLLNGEARQLTWWFWIFTTAMTSVMAVMGATSFGGERLAVLGGGPNVFGRSMVLWIIGVTILQQHWTFGRWLIWPVVVAMGTALTIMSGSRGASICLAVSLAIIFWNSSRKHFTKAVHVLMGTIYILVGVGVG